MQVLAVNGLAQNSRVSKSSLNSKNVLQNSISYNKEVTTDSFTKENNKKSKNVSFGGGTGVVVGTLIGIGAALAIVATAGLATPAVVGALATEVGCMALGSKLDED